MVTMVICTERREITRHTVEVSQEEHDSIINRINKAGFHNNDTVINEEAINLLYLPGVRITDCDMTESEVSGLYDPTSDIEYFD